MNKNKYDIEIDLRDVKSFIDGAIYGVKCLRNMDLQDGEEVANKLEEELKKRIILIKK